MKQVCIFEPRHNPCSTYLVSDNFLVLDNPVGQVSFLLVGTGMVSQPPYRAFLFSNIVNATHNASTTSTPNTRRFAVRQSSPTQSEKHRLNSHDRVNERGNSVPKHNDQGIQTLNQAGASYPFAKLISPKLFTSAYPCSLRVGVGMKSR